MKNKIIPELKRSSVIRKKYYVFRAGQELPSWLWGVINDPKKPESRIRNKNGRVTFGRSCVVVRVFGLKVNSLVMPASQGKHMIKISGFNNVEMGGVNGATGVMLIDDKIMNEASSLFNKYIMSSVIRKEGE